MEYLGKSTLVVMEVIIKQVVVVNNGEKWITRYLLVLEKALVNWELSMSVVVLVIEWASRSLFIENNCTKSPEKQFKCGTTFNCVMIENVYQVWNMLFVRMYNLLCQHGDYMVNRLKSGDRIFCYFKSEEKHIIAIWKMMRSYVQVMWSVCKEWGKDNK